MSTLNRTFARNKGWWPLLLALAVAACGKTDETPGTPVQDPGDTVVVDPNRPTVLISITENSFVAGANATMGETSNRWYITEGAYEIRLDLKLSRAPADKVNLLYGLVTTDPGDEEAKNWASTSLPNDVRIIDNDSEQGDTAALEFTNEETQYIRLQVNGDGIHEPGEYFDLRFRVTAGDADLSTEVIRFFMTDVDPQPQISFQIMEGETPVAASTVDENIGAVKLRAKLTPSTSYQDLHLFYQDSGSATVDEDYVNLRHRLITIPAETSELDLWFPIRDDLIREASATESLTLTLDAARLEGATLDAGASSVDITIVDNEQNTGSLVTGTGISLCTDATTQMTDCASVDATYAGQDGHQAQAASTFTLHDDATNGYQCAVDDSTGLMWELKVDIGGVPPDPAHFYETGYHWYNTLGHTNGDDEGSVGIVGDGSACLGALEGPKAISVISQKQEDQGCYTQRYVDFMNAIQLCGRSNWRLPSLPELMTIVRFDESGVPAYTNPVKPYATVDNTVFGYTQARPFWTSTPSPVFKSKAWAVDFASGRAELLDKVEAYAVRLVSSGP